MLIPLHWAEASARHRDDRRQVTVRRFGWSDTSAEAAQAHAQQRAEADLARVVAGEKLERREAKIPYNGADGMPIREQIVARNGDTVLTRNSYGAVCLNTPDVLFADVDFGGDGEPSWLMALLHRLGLAAGGGPAAAAMRRAEAFVYAHPDWRVRAYRTPAGLRLLALHRKFAPDDPQVAAFFAAVRADKMYVRMCRNQRCFRARLSAKPWRIGIAGHLRPRPGVWPVAPERLAEREHWLHAYDERARDYAACRVIGDFGGGNPDPQVDAVRQLHDDLCRAETQLPMA